ncbi:MAG TPA: ChaN family lipoprotein [Burkholderiales bacterium]
MTRGALALSLLAAAGIAAAQPAAPRAPQRECVPVAAWIAPGRGPLEAREVLERAARASVVLLGETHDSAEHHRWQLQVLAALHAQRPGMVLGFEAFPRRVQPALDRWVAGELAEGEFLAQTDWRTVWRFDAQLYLPLFHFARMHRIPMVALNVEPALTREVAQKGYDAVPAERREGVGRPAPPTDAYLDWLLPVWVEHERPGGKPAKPDRDDADFRRFVESQTLWDRAMAEALAAAGKRAGAPLVVGVMGTGHLAHGYGVPHQLKALGVADVATFLPWDRDAECGTLVSGLADAVFGLASPAPAAPARPRLGVVLEAVKEGVRILRVEKGSLAEAAGVREGDLLAEIAGVAPRQVGDVVEIVQRQAPGTWLPLKVRRGGATLELVARFPPRAP